MIIGLGLLWGLGLECIFSKRWHLTIWIVSASSIPIICFIISFTFPKQSSGELSLIPSNNRLSLLECASNLMTFSLSWLRSFESLVFTFSLICNFSSKHLKSSSLLYNSCHLPRWLSVSLLQSYCEASQSCIKLWFLE